MLAEHMYVQIKDHDGLCKINGNVVGLFKTVKVLL